MSPLKVIDLCSGTGGFSEAFKQRGHECADILHFSIRGSWDIILASPPCTEFTRDFLPWYNDPTQWWILENVKGSVKWIEPILGHHKKRIGSRYLWGDFPLFDCEHIYAACELYRRR